jgi:dTDP-4-dehydrorhamnose 3,5-epimerase
MHFVAAPLSGLFVVDVEEKHDDRGLFARTFCQREFAAHGLPIEFVQCNTSFSARRGTLRGMHFQCEPHAEGKLVRCTRGAIYDVALDLRKDSITFGRWEAYELSAENRRSLYIPPGLAHGFVTLADLTEVHYQMTACYEAAAARGVRWNDPAFAIRWPVEEPILSPRDATYPDFHP